MTYPSVDRARKRRREDSSSEEDTPRMPPRRLSHGRRLRSDIQASVELPAPQRFGSDEQPVASLSCGPNTTRKVDEAIADYFPQVLYSDSRGTQQQARLVSEVDLHNLVTSQYQLRRQLKAQDARNEKWYSKLHELDDESHPPQLRQSLNLPKIEYQGFGMPWEPIDLYKQSPHNLLYIHGEPSISATSPQHAAPTTTQLTSAQQPHEGQDPIGVEPNDVLAGKLGVLYDSGSEDQAEELSTAATQRSSASGHASSPRQTPPAAHLPLSASQNPASGNASPESLQQPSPEQAKSDPSAAQPPPSDVNPSAVTCQTAAPPPQTAPAGSISHTPASQSSNAPLQPVTVTKPPYTNADLMGMAITQAPGQSATTTQMFTWLRTNSVYFHGHAPKYWETTMRNALTNHPNWFQKVQQPATRGLAQWGIVPGQENRFANLVTQWTAAKTQSAVQPSITPTVPAMAASQPEAELDVSIPVGISYNLQVRALNLDSRENRSFSCFYDENLTTRPHDSLFLFETNVKQSAVNGNNHYAAVALSKDPDNVVSCETFLRENPLIESKDTNGSTWKHIPFGTPLRRERQLHVWFEERKLEYECLEIERGVTMAVKNTITTDVRCYLYLSKYQEAALRIIGEQLELTL